MGTLGSAIGLLLAGRATLTAGHWQDWRRYTVLAAGSWTLVLTGLAMAKALPAAVGVYGLCLLAVGLALYSSRPGNAVESIRAASRSRSGRSRPTRAGA